MDTFLNTHHKREGTAVIIITFRYAYANSCYFVLQVVTDIQIIVSTLYVNWYKKGYEGNKQNMS